MPRWTGNKTEINFVIGINANKEEKLWPVKTLENRSTSLFLRSPAKRERKRKEIILTKKKESSELYNSGGDATPKTSGKILRFWKLLRFIQRNCIIFHTFLLIFYGRWPGFSSFQLALPLFPTASSLFAVWIRYNGSFFSRSLLFSLIRSMKRLLYLITGDAYDDTILRHEIWYSIYHTYKALILYHHLKQP